MDCKKSSDLNRLVQLREKFKESYESVESSNIVERNRLYYAIMNIDSILFKLVLNRK